MPEFSTPFVVKKSDEKLTQSELIRAIRFMIAAEYEAIQLYNQTAESTDNKEATAILNEVANDEKVHAGCFLRLLEKLAPDEKNFYKEGASETDMITGS